MRTAFFLLASVAFACTALTQTAAAASLNYYGIDSVIGSNLLVDTTITMILESPVEHLDYNLDFRILNMSVKTSSGSSRCTFENSGSGSLISCDFYDLVQGDSDIELEFWTRDGIKRKDEGYEFRNSFPVTMPIKRLFSTVTLPPNGLLSEDIVNQSYFPPNGKVITDGKHIIVTWEKKDLLPADSLSFSVSFEVLGTGGVMWDLSVMAMISIVVIAMIGIAVYMRRGSAPAEQAVKVLPLLNKDEKSIVDILAKHEGSVRQREIVKESDFSKAKVSRLIKNLSERGVVETEPISGRENKVILKIKGVG